MCVRRRKAKPGKHLAAFALYTGGSMSVPVTKFSLRMYGSKKGVEEERQRQQSSGSFVIHPYSNFRFYWDCVSLILLIISMIVIPVAITFFNEKMTSVPGWMAFNLVLDSWFLTDIVINFHTGIIVEYGDGDVILDLHDIRCHYLKSWFAIDILSTLPIDYILQIVNGVSPSASASRAMKLFRFAKLLSLLRLLRISRLIRYVHQWEEIVNMQYDLAVAAVRIFNLVCLMLLIGHWNGCLQYLIPMLYDFPEDSWIVVDNLQNATWGEKYSWSLFKAMSHMLCIGYGQQPPKNVTDLWMTMISMMSGAVCFAMFIGHTSALIQSLDSSKRQYKEKYMQVKEYMRYRHLPKSLRMKVYEYYENRFQGKMFDEERILAEVSPVLREEIVNFTCRHLVKSVPLFIDADAEFLNEILQKLKFEVFQPTDVIMKEGTVGKKMYFMQHGVVEVRNKDNKNCTRLSDGSYFGEIGLLTNGRRVATVTAQTICCLYSLHADDFNEVLPSYPVMKRTLETVAASRLSQFGRCSSFLERRVKQQQSTDRTSKELAVKIENHDQKCARKANPSSKLNDRHAYGSNKISKFRQNNVSSPNRKCHAFLRRSEAFDTESIQMSANNQDDNSPGFPSDEAPKGFFRRILSRATQERRSHSRYKYRPKSSQRLHHNYRILEKNTETNFVRTGDDNNDAILNGGHQNGVFHPATELIATTSTPDEQTCIEDQRISEDFVLDEVAEVHATEPSVSENSVNDDFIEGTTPKAWLTTTWSLTTDERMPLSHAVSLPILPKLQDSGGRCNRVKSYQSFRA